MEKLVYDAIGETVYQKKLANGLQLYFIPKEESEKTFGLFMTNYGSVDRTFTPLQQTEAITVPDGIAHFLEHKLFEKEDRDVFNDFLQYGASPNAYTSATKTAYLFSATSNIAKNVEILLDFVQDPYFSDASVEKEKGIIAQEIKMYNDQIDFQLYMKTLQNMYENHPVKIDIAGTVASIQEITKEDLYTCYERFYHPSNMVLCLIGNFNARELCQMIEANQAAKSFSIAEAATRAMIDEPKSVKVKESTLHLPVSIPKVMIGIKEEMKDESPEARLKREIIQELVLDFYFATSGDFYEELYEAQLIDDSFGYQTTVEENFSFSLLSSNTDNPRQLLTKMKELLSAMTEKQVTEAELAMMKKRWLGEQLRDMDSLEHIANEYCHYYFEGIDYFTMRSCVQALQVEEINNHIKNWIQEDCITYCIVEKE